jgi:hypothetical protein
MIFLITAAIIGMSLLIAALLLRFRRKPPIHAGHDG